MYNNLGPVADGTIRLTRTYYGNLNEGNVEIYHNGTWGGICSNNFDRQDANVVCRQLGYPNATEHRCCSYYGGISNQLNWLSNLRCNGSESRISDCPGSSNWGANSCGRYQVAGVVCQGKWRHDTILNKNYPFCLLSFSKIAIEKCAFIMKDVLVTVSRILDFIMN